MKKNDKTTKTTATSEDEFERDVFRALMNSGSMVPEAESEVQAAEARMKQEHRKLPSHLKDPATLFSGKRAAQQQASGKVISFPGNVFSETGQELARAARKGKDIPTTVEEKMRRNRENLSAQKDADKDSK